MKPNALIVSILSLLSAFTLLASPALAAIKSRTFEYKAGETVLQGYIAWDDAIAGKRPGVLVVHEWWGHNEHARKQADRLAQAGYVGLALDMYGKGKVTTHPADAQKFAQEATKDAAVVAARFNAALDVLKTDEHVDATHVGAIGYCFGGRIVLDMAQHGADLAIAASFHGAVPPAAEAPTFKGRVVMFNGAADPMVPPDAVAAYVKGLATAHADFSLVNLPGAKHAFTNPAADKAGVDGLAYNAHADERSWGLLVEALKDTFR